MNFSSLGVAASALSADQQLMSIIDHNVANASTPGYSRQEGILTQNIPFPSMNFPNPSFMGQIGTGVQVASVQRNHLDSLDVAYQNENQTVGNLTTSSQILQEIQSAFSEPGSAGLNTLLGNFFQSLQQLSQSPSDLGVRNAVLQSANSLVNGIHSLNTALTNVITTANTQVSGYVTQINNILNQIASLNAQIRQVNSIPGQNANDLLDQRGELLDQLSNLININVQTEQNGSDIVSIGSIPLVQDDQVNPLSTYTDSQGRTQIQFQNFPLTMFPTFTVPLQSGELYGAINTRDKVLGTFSTSGTILYQLNQFVGQLVQNVNAVHQLGYDLNGNNNFFFNPDPDNDGDVEGGIGTDTSGIPDTATTNWLSGISVNITDPRQIDASVANVTSVQNINNLSATVDPNQPLSTQNFQVTPAAAGGIITINNVNISWTNSQTITQIIQAINSSNAGVVATFDPTTQKITLARNTLVNQTYVAVNTPEPDIQVFDTSGNLSQVFLINTTNNTLTGTAAISTKGTPGDGTNLGYLTQLQNLGLTPLGGDSLTQYYNQIVSNMGTETSQAQTNLTSEKSVLQQIDQQRQSISGVNLNEEAVALTQAQQAFNAAARVMTTIDDVLNKLINGTGRVGL